MLHLGDLAGALIFVMWGGASLLGLPLCLGWERHGTNISKHQIGDFMRIYWGFHGWDLVGFTEIYGIYCDLMGSGIIQPNIWDIVTILGQGIAINKTENEMTEGVVLNVAHLGLSFQQHWE